MALGHAGAANLSSMLCHVASGDLELSRTRSTQKLDQDVIAPARGNTEMIIVYPNPDTCVSQLGQHLRGETREYHEGPYIQRYRQDRDG